MTKNRQNKNGYGQFVFEPVEWANDKGELVYVTTYGLSSHYDYEHPKFGQRNDTKIGSKFRSIMNDLICQNENGGYIEYKTAEQRDKRMMQAKQQLEEIGYEIVIQDERFKNFKDAISFTMMMEDGFTFPLYKMRCCTTAHEITEIVQHELDRYKNSEHYVHNAYNENRIARFIDKFKNK